jgi:hypothetical protein
VNNTILDSKVYIFDIVSIHRAEYINFRCLFKNPVKKIFMQLGLLAEEINLNKL